MPSPNPNLVHIFVVALTTFNDAFKATPTAPPTAYNALKDYLLPKPGIITVYRVDDAKPIQGDQDYIINDFNTTQATPGYFPRLDFSGSAPMQDTPSTVTGVGYYTDRLGATPIKVAYRYHFNVPDPKKPDDAFIDTAFVIRIP
jgi:hypothetical protein